MPTYEYKCTVCAERFEVVQTIAEDSLTTIEDCTQSDDKLHHVKKVFGSVGIAFKGSGFYRNDARDSSSSNSSGSSSTTSDSSSSGGSDSGGSSAGSSTSSSSSDSKTSDKSSTKKSTTSDNSAA